MTRASRPSQKWFEKIKSHLDSGGVIAYATESCYGLGCDPRNVKAIRHLLRIKQRKAEKGLILIAGNLKELKPYCVLPEKKRLDPFWPGPFTLLLKPSRSAPRWLLGKNKKIAVRLTAHAQACGLCLSLNMALVSTSANRSGLKPVKSYRQCLKKFGEKALVLPGKIGERKKPSTILDFENGKILRN